MPKESANVAVRRRPVQISIVKSFQGHSHRLSLSDNGSQSGDSMRVSIDLRSQAATWDVSSQGSTAAVNPSSLGSPSLERPASRSTAATEHSQVLIDASKVKKLGPLHEHLQTIRKYTPSQEAAVIWAETASELNVAGATGDETLTAGPDHGSWTLWERMANVGDALTSARYLNEAFNIHYLCFVDIFHDTAQRLFLWKPASSDAAREDEDRKTSKVIVGSPPVLQLLIRTAIGAARSCTTAVHGKLARVMIDAAHSVLRHTKYPNRNKALLILFDIYRTTMVDLWSDQSNPTPQDQYGTSPIPPKSSRLNQEYSLDDLLLHVHPAIINREYLVLSTHLLNLARFQKSWLSLPARTTAWERPMAHFLRDLAVPTKSSQAWVELIKERQPPEPTHFIEVYKKDATAFIRWCTNVIFESRSFLDETFTPEQEAARIVSRGDLNNARLALYWFLVARRKSLQSQTAGSAHSAATSLPSFPLADNKACGFDALFLLSSYVFGFCTPEPLPSSLPSISGHALGKLNQMVTWPCGFIWCYLRLTVSLVSRLHEDGDPLQDAVDLERLVSITLDAEEATTADTGAPVAAEMHPQPLPEFIIAPVLQPDGPLSPLSKTSSPKSLKVSFVESPGSSSPAKSSKKRWFHRFNDSLSRIDISDFSGPVKSKRTSTTNSRESPATTSPTPTPTPTKKPSSMTSTANNSKRNSLALQADARVKRLSTAESVSRFHSPDDFPGDYVAIAPLMSSPDSDAEGVAEAHRRTTRTNGVQPQKPPPPPPPQQQLLPPLTFTPFEPDKIGPTVQSTEILVPESRPSFVVMQ